MLTAVDGVSFAVGAGETLALLGESGCGKSASALALMRLLPPGGRMLGGEVHFAGQELFSLPEAVMRDVRGSGLAMIFQEPATSLNPVLTVGRQIGEALARHVGLSGAAARARAQELLAAVGIADAARRLDEYPFQLSGGMKQRVMIAIALAADPRVLIADEPTTALDVTIQAQILDLLRRLQAERGMGMLLITHDLGVVARMAQRVAVMYAGQIVEEAPREAFFSAPAHPYTRMLFAALPDLATRGGTLATIPGQVPALDELPSGCRFAPRCPQAVPRCRAARRRVYVATWPSRWAPPLALRRQRASKLRTLPLSLSPPRSSTSPTSPCISRSSAASSSAPSATCAPSTASRSPWRPGARWRWSANRAAARPPSARPCCN